MKRYKYAVIGAGSIADVKHLATYSKRDDIDIVAICDKNIKRAKEMAQKYKVDSVFSSYDKLFEAHSDLDIISVCMPNALHYPVIEYALKHNIHVHSEKPLAISVEEINKIMELKKNSSSKLMIGLDKRYLPAMSYLKGLIASGKMGNVYNIKAFWQRRRGIPGVGGWFTQKKLSGGGPLIDLGVHLIDLGMYFLDFPNVKDVLGQVYYNFSENYTPEMNSWGMETMNVNIGKIDVEDSACGLIKFENKATLFFEVAWASNVAEEKILIEVLGDKAGAKIENDQLTIYTEQEGKLIDVTPILELDNDLGYKMYDYKAYVQEVDLFIQCINERIDTPANVEQSKKVMSVIEDIYKSS